MASTKTTNPYDQYCNDNEQEQDQDGYGSMNKSSPMHDYPSHHVHHPRGHDQITCNNGGAVHDESSIDHQSADSNETNHNQEPVPLNLTLTITEPFSRRIEFTLNQEKQQNNHQEVLSQSQPPQKLKASNLSAVFLRVGSWNWESRNLGDLVVKFYYGKKKLVWEFLFGSLKKKMEMRWAQVSAINAYVDEDKKGRLEIELKDPPEYYQEYKFQALKHTQWKKTNDFTQGQAPIYRRHTIHFPPRVLDEPFEKLLQYENRLFNLSRQPFPFLNSEFFNPNMESSHNHIDIYKCQPIPLANYDYQQGTILPYVQNLMQPNSSFVGNSFSNLPIQGSFPNSNDITREVSYVQERSNGVCEQGGINQTQETLVPLIIEQNDYEPITGGLEQNGEMDSNLFGNLMSDENHHVDPLHTILPPIKQQDDNEILGDLEPIISDEQLMCKPLEQNYQINSNPSSNWMSDGNHNVGESHIDHGVAYMEENFGLPLTNDLGGSGDMRNHMEYMDDDVCRFAEEQFNDVFAIHEPWSWLS